MKSLLSFPHSNANAEQIFSHVTLIKTKSRNKIKTSTLDALLLTKQSLPFTCVQFQPNASMCKRMGAGYTTETVLLTQNDLLIVYLLIKFNL